MYVFPRVVIDTNVWVSGLISKHSPPGKIVALALSKNLDVFADDRLSDEIMATFQYPKFDRYVTREEKQLLFFELFIILEQVDITETVTACRDPRDNHILEIAINGKANCIISGDKDLLVLHPFRDIPILSPTEFLEKHA